MACASDVFGVAVGANQKSGDIGEAIPAGWVVDNTREAGAVVHDLVRAASFAHC